MTRIIFRKTYSIIKLDSYLKPWEIPLNNKEKLDWTYKKYGRTHKSIEIKDE